MNLYIFNDSSNGALYGIGTYVNELIRSLSCYDININVINLYSETHKVILASYEGVSYWSFPKPIEETRCISNKKMNELYLRNVIYYLQLHIRDKKNLIFHLNYNYNSSFSKRLKEVFNCHIITCVHYLDWCLKINGNRSAFRKKLSVLEDDITNEFDRSIRSIYLKEKDYFDSVDLIICLSLYTREILYKDYKIQNNKLNVVSNGLTDLKQRQRKQLRAKYNVPDGPVMIFAGRVDSKKGLGYALHAFKRVLKVVPSCHFIIVGSGDFDLHLEECEDIWMHITWTGKLKRNKLYDMYSIANFGILPSLTEQCSYVAIEMMMHGLPIIVSSYPALAEMVIDNYNGLHVPIEESDEDVTINVTTLANKIIDLILDANLYNRLSLNARKQYETLYSIEAMGKKMWDIYSLKLDSL